tara:strand:+ start:1452 stop:1937 length:486 start_codon:yes stop_codon:yes gene_type:complete
MDSRIRIGQGWDRHALKKGRPLVLMGVKIDSSVGPVSHSDGDVIAHVVSDAILGACSSGDIGSLFPDDQSWTEGISGTELLNKTLEFVNQEKTISIIQVDVIVKLEEPRLSPYVGIIEENLSLALDAESVRVTARHGEGVGAIGRGECIDASAIILIRSKE